MAVIEIIGSALIVISAIECWAFAGLYQWRTQGRWRASETGRHLMTTNLVFAMVLTMSTVRIVAGARVDVPWFQWLRTIVFVGVPIVFAGQLWLLWIKQERPRQPSQRGTNDRPRRDHPNGER
jgi:uncharacterized membrane protein YgdD (TMEM256/DUF423 family)